MKRKVKTDRIRNSKKHKVNFLKGVNFARKLDENDEMWPEWSEWLNDWTTQAWIKYYNIGD